MDEKELDAFIAEIETDMFRVNHFNSIGKGDDYIFQTLVFAGDASKNLSIAYTIASDCAEVPEEVRAEFRDIQERLHNLKETLRACQSIGNEVDA